MIKIPISQQGQAITFIASPAKLYFDGEANILIHVHERVEQPGMSPTVDLGKYKPMQVDDTTRLPAVHRQVAADGTETFTPITRVEMRQARDEAGNLLFWMVTDETGDTYPHHAHPLLEPVEVQRTVGELQAVLWWHFSKLNPEPRPGIEEMIEEGIRRKLGLSDKPYHFVVTDAFVAVYGDNW